MRSLAVWNYEELFLSKGTTKLGTELCDWAPAIGGELHPALCPKCASFTNRDYSPSSSFTPSPGHDVCITLDSYIILSGTFLDALRVALAGFSAFRMLPGTDRGVLVYEELPVIGVETELSGIRRSLFCDLCNDYAEVLYGLELTPPPPHPRAIMLREQVDESVPAIYRTDIELGSNFKKKPRVYFTLALKSVLAKHDLRGLEYFAYDIDDQ